MTISVWRTAFPRQWETRRLKYLAPVSNERVGAVEEDDFYLGLEGIQAGTGKLVVKSNEEDDVSNNNDEGEAFGTANIFHAGDVLFGKLRPYLAKVVLADRSGHCSTEIIVLRPSADVLGSFLKYALLSPDFIQSVDSSTFGARMPRASWDFIGNITVPVPTLSTQRRIADFLDRETTQIDALIEAKEQMLALLQEKRAAQISHMVTKGLDPNVELKDSGLEWLGEIPAHWEVRRIKSVAYVGNGSTPNRENADYWEGGTFPWLNSSVVNQDVVEEASRFVTETALAECHLPVIEPPAVLIGITGQGKTRGRSTVLDFQATINQHLAYVKAKDERLDAFYLSHLLESAYEYLRSESEGTGSTKGAITCEQIAEFRISLPPLNEQQIIVATIRVTQQQYSGIEEDLTKSLSLLRERRSALITAAVTGQLAEVLE